MSRGLNAFLDVGEALIDADAQSGGEWMTWAHNYAANNYSGKIEQFSLFIRPTTCHTIRT